MDLSIIIPVHNLEKFLAPLLNSLQAQEFAPYEVELIFVLDDCTDNTAKILRDFYADQYKLIRLINTSVRSCGLARNIGLNHAEGEYIWFVDGDDWITEPDAISMILDAMKSSHLDIVKFDYEAPNFDFYGYPSMVWQYCMKRDFIGDLRFTAIQPHEDVKFMGTLTCDMDEPIKKIDRVLYHYNYMREGSNMQQFRTTGIIQP